MVGASINYDAKQGPFQCIKDFSSRKEDLCSRIKPTQISANVLENVLDIGSTLVNIMQLCGIHKCKANRALDIIIYAFMHFDEVAEHPGGKCKKRIRKEEFNNDLTRDCGMTKADAKLTYSIVKCAFKAFYHKQGLKNYNMGLVDECVWRSAANKTVSAFAHSGASKSQIELTGRRILSVYENFICRLQARSSRKAGPINPCVCTSPRSSVPQQRPCEHVSDPCKFEYLQPCQSPDPPLCAQLQCQFVCPPGSSYPQIICKDPCGRLFLKVDGDMICFDPLILECEARRAAMEVCPPSNAERIKALRECIKPCMPKDTDSCDEKLAEIDAEGEEKVDDQNAARKDFGSGSEVSENLEDEVEAASEDEVIHQGEKEGKGKIQEEEEDEEREEKGKGKEKGKEKEKKEGKEKEAIEEEDAEEEVGKGFFISAELRTLENGKRRLDVKIRGKCRKSEKYINLLNGLHVEGNRDEEMWYELTPTSGPPTDEKDISNVPSQVSEAVSNAPSQVSEAVSNTKSKQSHISENKSEAAPAASKSQVADEDKSDTGEPAKNEVLSVNEDVAAQNDQGSGEPAAGSTGDKNSNIVEPGNEDAGEELNEAPAETAN